LTRYNVILMPSAEKELEELPKKVVQRINDALLSLVENPRPRGSIKLKGEGALYRIRVGDYRVIYEIHDEKVTVLVIRIRHRKNAY
jgi:mRNA interferase RelE/StbE